MDNYEKALSAFVDISYSLLTPAPSAFAPLEKHPLALEKRRIMHPFLGEMGLEIRGFLGSIEPWLRAGWIIPARRSSLYPAMTAFEDPVYFERVNAIKSAYGLREMTGRLQKLPPTKVDGTTEKTQDTLKLTISGDIDNELLPALAARRDLRRAFFDRYGHDQLVPTRWHTKLSSQSYTDDELEETARWAVIPGYLPASFDIPPFDFPKHVGVQLRNVPHNPSRNSDPQRMERLATEAAKILGLPLLVYGRKEDFSLPNIQRTTELLPEGTPQMAAELAFLKHCVLMISPDSGWTDLMGWLRIPTLLERAFFPWGFEGLRPFSPRIILANDDNLRASIDAVLAPDIECVLPNPRQGEITNDFLAPDGSTCKEYWQTFCGRD